MWRGSALFKSYGNLATQIFVHIQGDLGRSGQIQVYLATYMRRGTLFVCLDGRGQHSHESAENSRPLCGHPLNCVLWQMTE